MGVAVIIAGGRDNTHQDAEIKEVLNELMQDTEGHVFLIQGGAKGVDSSAKRIALSMCIPVLEIPADWNAHGKRAGFLRNEAMLEWLLALKANLGWDIEVHTFNGGNGTIMMRKLAMSKNVPTFNHV